MAELYCYPRMIFNKAVKVSGNMTFSYQLIISIHTCLGLQARNKILFSSLAFT